MSRDSTSSGPDFEQVVLPSLELHVHVQCKPFDCRPSTPDAKDNVELALKIRASVKTRARAGRTMLGRSSQDFRIRERAQILSCMEGGNSSLGDNLTITRSCVSKSPHQVSLPKLIKQSDLKRMLIHRFVYTMLCYSLSSSCQ